MNRQEPVIDSRFLKCRTLKDRVDLSWETVENLTKQMQTPIPTQAPVQSQPVAEIEPQPFEPYMTVNIRCKIYHSLTSFVNLSEVNANAFSPITVVSLKMTRSRDVA